MCVTHFDVFSMMSELHIRTRTLLKHLKLLRRILALTNTTSLQFDHWTQLWDLSNKDPRKIVADLVNSLEFDLARECAQLLLVNEPLGGLDDAKSVAAHIEEQWILHILKNQYERKF
jgi:hypothetical protein